MGKYRVLRSILYMSANIESLKLLSICSGIFLLHLLHGTEKMQTSEWNIDIIEIQRMLYGYVYKCIAL